MNEYFINTYLIISQLMKKILNLENNVGNIIYHNKLKLYYINDRFLYLFKIKISL